MIRLPVHLADKMCEFPETAMGYQDVDVTLKNGQSVKGRLYNCSLLESTLPQDFNTALIEDIDLVSPNVITSSAKTEGNTMPEEKKKPTDHTNDSDSKPEKKDKPEVDKGGNPEDDGVEFIADEQPEETMEEMPLLGGGGLLKILEHVIPLLQGLPTDGSGRDEIDNPFELLSDNDFDDEDPAVKHFSNEGGCKTVIKLIKVDPQPFEKLSTLANNIAKIRFAHRMNIIRNTFSAIQAAMKGNEGGKKQLQAVEALEVLACDASSPAEQRQFLKARESVLAGTRDHLDAAAYRVREVFSSYIPKPNVRTAYTTLSTQGNEPYLMCPKGTYVYGHAVPMEISKCRDNCVDSRATVEGGISCAYHEWLKKQADTQEAAWNRPDRWRNPENDKVLLTLAKGERSKPITKNEIWYEQRFDEAGLHTVPVNGKDGDGVNREKQLDETPAVNWGHQGKEKESDRPAVKFAGVGTDKIDADSSDTMGEQISEAFPPKNDDEIWETRLNDSRSGLNDDDLDTVVELLLAKERAKK